MVPRARFSHCPTILNSWFLSCGLKWFIQVCRDPFGMTATIIVITKILFMLQRTSRVTEALSWAHFMSHRFLACVLTVFRNINNFWEKPPLQWGYRLIELWLKIVGKIDVCCFCTWPQTSRVHRLHVCFFSWSLGRFVSCYFKKNQIMDSSAQTN